jgi:hypothetical protein
VALMSADALIRTRSRRMTFHTFRLEQRNRPTRRVAGSEAT